MFFRRTLLFIALLILSVAHTIVSGEIISISTHENETIYGKYLSNSNSVIFIEQKIGIIDPVIKETNINFENIFKIQYNGKSYKGDALRNLFGKDSVPEKKLSNRILIEFPLGAFLTMDKNVIMGGGATYPIFTFFGSRRVGYSIGLGLGVINFDNSLGLLVRQKMGIKFVAKNVISFLAGYDAFFITTGRKNFYNLGPGIELDFRFFESATSSHSVSISFTQLLANGVGFSFTINYSFNFYKKGK